MQTFALAMLIFAVAAAGTTMIGIMPRTSFLSLPFWTLGPCRELLCGGLRVCRVHVNNMAAPALSELYPQTRHPVQDTCMQSPNTLAC